MAMYNLYHVNWNTAIVSLHIQNIIILYAKVYRENVVIFDYYRDSFWRDECSSPGLHQGQVGPLSHPYSIWSSDTIV